MSEKIRSLYESGYSVPVIREQPFDVSPWEFYQRIYSEGRYSFFLDSLHYQPPAQRYSYIGWKPYHRVFLKNGSFQRTDLSAEMRKLFSPVRIPAEFSFDFFTGGAVGFWGYELSEAFERISFRPKKGPRLPTLGLLFFRDIVVFDHKRERYYLISWLIPRKNIPFRKALRKAEENLIEMERALTLPSPLALNGHFRLLRFVPEISRTDFEGMVLKAKRYIEAGDIYQANLSQRFSFNFRGSPLRLYDRLRETNPSPFSAVLRFGDLFIASSSPELLVAKKGRHCVTCPIAGTRPRGSNPSETRKLAHELLTNEKERAEHLMLVDLERNDLGRVSEWRSVRVKDFMRLEKYSRVQHIVSEIESQLKPSKDAWDLIRAMFPGGTITGCPKIRSMEIIDELEPVERGIYTGSIGYVGFDGDLMLNIAIRTLVLLGKKGYLQVGAGIVADSDPTREYEETLHKGEALAEALVQAATV